MTHIELALLLEDFISEQKVESADDLESSERMLHDIVSTACQDYADDYSIEDYEPQY